MKKINYEFHNKKNIYNDGKIEEELFDYYEHQKEIDFSREDIFFFTTDIRENIINWYPFSKKDKVLEIGAGLGTITSALCEKCGKVVAVEGSQKRAEVIAARHQNYENLDIYCANFNDIKFKEKYDYIIMIGVFEYSKVYCDSEKPFETFINNIKKLLNKNGKLLIAIENRFGIKYWAGLAEDHFQIPYVGMEGYKADSHVKTFGKKEINVLFEKLGFRTIKYYYPFPDYKMPEIIFTDQRLPKINEIQKLTNYNYSNESYNFIPNKVLKGILENDNFDFFANSFLIELSLIDNNCSDISYVKFQNDRRKEFQIITCISDNNKIYKFPKNNESIEHLKKMKVNHNYLISSGIKCSEIYDDYSIEYIEGMTVLERIIELYKAEKYTSIKKEIKEFIDYLYKISNTEKINNPFCDEIKNCWKEIKVLPLGLFDLHFDNVIKKDEYIFIDQEWVTEKQLPIEYNIYISLNVLYDKFPEMNNICSIYELYDEYSITEEKINIIEKCRKQFFIEQNQIVNEKSASILMRKNTIKLIKEDIENKNNEISELKQQILDYTKQNEELFKQNEITNQELENLKNESKQQIDLLKKQLLDECQKSNMAKENENYYSNELSRILNSRSWKITKPLRLIVTFIKKIITKMKIKKIIVKCLRFMYKYFPLPLSTKRRILDKITNKSSIVRRIRYSQYNNNLYLINSVNSNNIQCYGFDKKLEILNKKIAIHAHIYYIDLLEEFCGYMNNMPYKFDLFVSVPKKDYINVVKEKCKELKNVNKIVVKKCENVGRDFSPLFVEFGEKISKYDYVCHIHTKKSIRTGVEQDGWRTHLISSLLGTEDTIKSIFYMFENNIDIGMIYPETYKDMPYWAHTFLQNRPMCNELAGKFGITLSDQYFDYSVGSFFWAKTDALKKIFDLNLKYSDFGKEEGKNDGTFAHAIERMLPFAVISSNYKYLVIDIEQQIFKNNSHKNLWQYCCQTPDLVINKFKNYKNITFDIFDTLIARMIQNPSDIFDLMEKDFKNNGIKRINNFKKIRFDAEMNIRVKNKFIGDVTIDEIYEELGNLTGLNSSELKKIKELEKEYEIRFCIPRRDMLRIFNQLKKSNKKITLISDMYLDSSTITKMLNKCGYYDWDELIISCEVQKRKDNGTMWDYYFEKNKNTIHCGDNETSDIQAVCDRNRDFVHILQGNKILNLTGYGSFISSVFPDLSITDKVILGSILNKKAFNSPFREDFNKIVDNYQDYGYTFLGPIFLKFFLWLDEETKKNKNDKLLFLAREGYFFEKIYEKFCEIKNVEPISHNYFLASRRSVSIAAINNMKDIEELVDKYYVGGIKNLFKSRFGYEIKIEDFEIELPRDKKQVLEVFKNIEKEYFELVGKEKDEYKKYVTKCTKKFKNIAVVDLGYSGTIQYYLSKLMNNKYSGYYFITDRTVHPEKIGCKVYSCFNVMNVENFEDKILYYSLILEAFLTAPYGQLINFKNGKPNYNVDVISDNELKNLEDIYSGVIEFITDIVNLIPNISSDDISNKLICQNFASLVTVDGILSADLESNFRLEDKYCSDSITNVFELLKSRRDKNN